MYVCVCVYLYIYIYIYILVYEDPHHICNSQFQLVMLCISETNNGNGNIPHFGKKNSEKLLTVLLHVWKKPKLAPLLGYGKCHL